MFGLPGGWLIQVVNESPPQLNVFGVRQLFETFVALYSVFYPYQYNHAIDNQIKNVKIFIVNFPRRYPRKFLTLKSLVLQLL